MKQIITTITISQCIDCTEYDSSDGICIVFGIKTNGHPGDPIPDWCPLDDKEEVIPG